MAAAHPTAEEARDVVIKNTSKKHGQAIVEFVVAMVAILAVVTGVIVIGRLQLAHTQSMIEARYEVANSVLAPQAMLSYDATWLHGWNYGADERAYTADDTPIYSLVTRDIALNVANNSMLDTLNDLPANRISAFEESADYSYFLPMVKGSRHITVDLSDIPFLREFFGFSRNIGLKTELYMTYSGNLQ